MCHFMAVIFFAWCLSHSFSRFCCCCCRWIFSWWSVTTLIVFICAGGIFMMFSHHGPRFSMIMSSYHYRKSHCGDMTMILPSSYLHSGSTLVRWHLYMEPTSRYHRGCEKFGCFLFVLGFILSLLFVFKSTKNRVNIVNINFVSQVVDKKEPRLIQRI